MKNKNKRLSFETCEARELMTIDLSVNDPTVTEGGIAAFVINSDERSSRSYSIQYETRTGTAGSADYEAKRGWITMPKNATSVNIPIQTIDDQLIEATENFSLRILSTTRGRIRDNSGKATVLDNDTIVVPPPDPTPTTGYGQQQNVTAPTGAIIVTTNSQLASAASNATIFLKAGTYSALSLKSGQTVIGEYGTRITGTSSRAANVVSNVTLSNLIFDGFRPSSEWDGSLHLGDNAKLINCEVKNSTLAGIFVEGDNVLVDGCWIHHNQRTGIKTDYTTGLIVRNSDISYNNPDKKWDIYNEAGGSKFWGSTNMLLENNYVHHNQGNGLWFDYKNNSTIIRNNKTEANTLAGIFWEISYSVQIYDNQSFGDGVGYSNTGWLNGAAIVIENSCGTSNNPIIVRNNISTNSINGIGLINVAGRTERTLGGDFPTAWIQVLNNQLINSGKSGYVGDGGRPSNLTWSGNILTGNSRLIGNLNDSSSSY